MRLLDIVGDGYGPVYSGLRDYVNYEDEKKNEEEGKKARWDGREGRARNEGKGGK